MSSGEEEAEFDDGAVEEDVAEEEPEEGSRRKRKAVNYAEDVGEEEEEEDYHDDDEDDSDDDKPLSALKEKKSPAKSKSPTKKAVASPKAKAKKKAKPAVKSPIKPTATKSTEYLSASSALYESDCKKGALIQKLLCRWWYAVTWPDPSVIPEKPPKHYDALEGFKGVYVCTSGDKVGHILDLRDKHNCPSFSNYVKKTSEELKELLLKALEEQKRQLIEAEGRGTQTEKEINDDIKWVNKNIKKPETADKEAEKVLKAAKLKL